jgi:hypothetical protein
MFGKPDMDTGAALYLGKFGVLRPDRAPHLEQVPTQRPQYFSRINPMQDPSQTSNAPHIRARFEEQLKLKCRIGLMLG